MSSIRFARDSSPHEERALADFQVRASTMRLRLHPGLPCGITTIYHFCSWCEARSTYVGLCYYNVLYHFFHVSSEERSRWIYPRRIFHSDPGKCLQFLAQ